MVEKEKNKIILNGTQKIYKTDNFHDTNTHFYMY